VDDIDIQKLKEEKAVTDKKDLSSGPFSDQLGKAKVGGTPYPQTVPMDV